MTKFEITRPATPTDTFIGRLAIVPGGDIAMVTIDGRRRFIGIIIVKKDPSRGGPFPKIGSEVFIEEKDLLPPGSKITITTD